MKYPKKYLLSYSPEISLELFSYISHQPWSMLLYSGKNHTKIHRFDILVAYPGITLITQNKYTYIKQYDCNKFSISTENPFFLVKKYLQHSGMHASYDSNLPFQGGALGLFGYDLSKHLFLIPSISRRDISVPDMAIGIYYWAIIVDHILCRTTLITHKKNVIKIFQKLCIRKQNNSNVFQLYTNWNTNMNYKIYKKNFYKIKQHILNGNCYQICLGIRYQAYYHGDEWKIFCYLLNYNCAPFSAFIKLRKHSILSFSPECFLNLKNNFITSCPIKGTISKSNNIQKNQQNILQLSNSIKNQAENLMIVDLLRNDIGKVAQIGTVSVVDLFKIKTFSIAHHMISTVIGQLNCKYSPLDLLQSCFPGGSITGAPKISAMHIIEELEPNRRNAWCGSIGYISCCNSMNTNIVIRTLIASEKQLFCSVGSGIVHDSDLDEEYQEVILKSSSLLPPLLNFLKTS